MLEIRKSRTAVISCRDTASVLNTMPQLPGVFAGRVAADELLWIGAATAVDELLQRAWNHLERGGSFGIAVDMSDAWSVCTVTGDKDEVEYVWALLSQNPLPQQRPAFVQGAAASLPGKAIVLDGTIHFLTPSPVGYHLPERVLQAARDANPRRNAPAEFVLNPSAEGAMQ